MEDNWISAKKRKVDNTDSGNTSPSIFKFVLPSLSHKKFIKHKGVESYDGLKDDEIDSDSEESRPHQSPKIGNPSKTLHGRGFILSPYKNVPIPNTANQPHRTMSDEHEVIINLQEDNEKSNTKNCQNVDELDIEDEIQLYEEEHVRGFVQAMETEDLSEEQENDVLPSIERKPQINRFAGKVSFLRSPQQSTKKQQVTASGLDMLRSQIITNRDTQYIADEIRAKRGKLVRGGLGERILRITQSAVLSSEISQTFPLTITIVNIVSYTTFIGTLGRLDEQDLRDKIGACYILLVFPVEKKDVLTIGKVVRLIPPWGYIKLQKLHVIVPPFSSPLDTVCDCKHIYTAEKYSIKERVPWGMQPGYLQFGSTNLLSLSYPSNRTTTNTLTTYIGTHICISGTVVQHLFDGEFILSDKSVTVVNKNKSFISQKLLSLKNSSLLRSRKQSIVHLYVRSTSGQYFMVAISPTLRSSFKVGLKYTFSGLRLVQTSYRDEQPSNSLIPLLLYSEVSSFEQQ